jgi:hypothetical protein
MSHKINWSSEPQEQDYPAAQSYLTLLYDRKVVKAFVKGLINAPMSEFKAKDIFRASCLPLLGDSNTHVQKDQKKIEAGQEISPLLLVRDAAHGKVVIADGYHRLCAVYSFDENAMIPCKIV